MMICFPLTQLHLFVVDFLHFRLISKFKIDIIVIYIDLWWTVVKKHPYVNYLISGLLTTLVSRGGIERSLKV